MKILVTDGCGFIGTGVLLHAALQNKVKRFHHVSTDEAFAEVGLDYRDYVVTDPHFVPPVETGPLCGDASRAKKVLGWKPKTNFKQLVGIMVQADLARYS